MNVRAPQPDDDAAVADLPNEVAHAYYGELDLDEAEVRRWWAMPEVEALVAEDGRLAGYADVNVEDERGVAYLDVRPLPGDHWDFQPTPFERFARWNLSGERFDPGLQRVARRYDTYAKEL